MHDMKYRQRFIMLTKGIDRYIYLTGMGRLARPHLSRQGVIITAPQEE